MKNQCDVPQAQTPVRELVERLHTARHTQREAADARELRAEQGGDGERGRALQAEVLAQDILDELESAIMRDPPHEAGADTLEREVPAVARGRGPPQPCTPSTPRISPWLQDVSQTESPVKAQRVADDEDDGQLAGHPGQDAELTPTRKEDGLPQ